MEDSNMLERRQWPRSRVYYGGLVAFNARNSTLACVVRNFSKRGAKIEFENSTMLPDRVDFEIERRGLSRRARLVWRDHNAAGLVFSDLQNTVEETSDVIPLDLARKLRATERANRRLQSRLDQLLSEL
jgi:PilZ domain